MKTTADMKKAEVFAAGALFFHSWREARELLGVTGPERDFRLEYDFLFRGTDADFLPPLWASFSQEDRELCNAVTLDVIRFYHRWGYAPERVEGNPPDYIGEQLAFLAYLTAAGESGAAEQFIRS